jgi:hypothetical protein
VPIRDDIMDHEMIGPEIRRGMAMGQREMIVRLLTQRFGSVPAWANDRLEAASIDELDAIALGILEAPGIDRLFG